MEAQLRGDTDMEEAVWDLSKNWMLLRLKSLDTVMVLTWHYLSM